jgi:hypothetical protein
MDRILALREPTVPLVERMEKQRVNAHTGAFSYFRNTPKLLKFMLFLLNKLVVLRFTQACKGSCDGLCRVMSVPKLLILIQFFCPFNFLEISFWCASVPTTIITKAP